MEENTSTVSLSYATKLVGGNGMKVTIRVTF